MTHESQKLFLYLKQGFSRSLTFSERYNWIQAYSGVWGLRGWQCHLTNVICLTTLPSFSYLLCALSLVLSSLISSAAFSIKEGSQRDFCHLPPVSLYLRHLSQSVDMKLKTELFLFCGWEGSVLSPHCLETWENSFSWQITAFQAAREQGQERDVSSFYITGSCLLVSKSSCCILVIWLYLSAASFSLLRMCIHVCIWACGLQLF